jgi:hypothetical protein
MGYIKVNAIDDLPELEEDVSTTSETFMNADEVSQTEEDYENVMKTAEVVTFASVYYLFGSYKTFCKLKDYPIENIEEFIEQTSSGEKNVDEYINDETNNGSSSIFKFFKWYLHE